MCHDRFKILWQCNARAPHSACLGEVLLRRMWQGWRCSIVIASTAADGERGTTPEVHGVQASHSFRLAACDCGVPESKFAIREQRTLLVAHSQAELLVLQADAGRMRTAALGIHAEATAQDAGAHRGALIVHSTGMAPAAGPRARANGGLAVCQQAALLVAEASK